ncbi:MAG: hypothetical protein U1F15_09755 [Burkholderiales bacterium]
MAIVRFRSAANILELEETIMMETDTADDNPTGGAPGHDVVTGGARVEQTAPRQARRRRLSA